LGTIIMMTFFASTLFALLAQSIPATAAPPTAVQISQWSTYDMALTATGQYDSPLSVDLTGVFNGPDGQAVMVKGFWDGGQTYRIRFTPTREGTWTFMTVSDDPGLDGRLGSITCLKATDGTHGFVRESPGASGRWVFDDGTAVDAKVTAVATGNERLDLTGFRAGDALVSAAAAEGRVAEIALFDADPATMSEAQLYDDVQYMTARYGAFPNVVWCVQPASANTPAQQAWRTAQTLVQQLDPYYGQDPRDRVLRTACTPERTTSDARLGSVNRFGVR
jgi:Domain of unknown function (DUF5060)